MINKVYGIHKSDYAAHSDTFTIHIVYCEIHNCTKLKLNRCVAYEIN